MDFLTILPNELSEHIFSYLDSKSILDCFLVSPSWKEFLETSLTFKRRFALDLRQLKFDFSQFKLITKTQRNFTNAFVYIYPCENLESRLKMTNYIVKKLNIEKISLELSFFDCTVEGFSKYLNMFKGRLDDLKIQLMTINDATDESEINIDLSSLKSVDIVQGANLEFILNVLTKAKNLKSLKLGGLQMYDKMEPKVLHDLLVQLKHVTKLQLDFEWCEIFFKQANSDFHYPFELKDLQVFVGTNEINQMMNFLKNQRKIRNLNIYLYDKFHRIDSEFLINILQMRKLKSLKLSANLIEELSDDIQIPLNKSLKNLSITSFLYKTIAPKTMEKLIKSLPFVKYINVQGHRLKTKSILDKLKI